ncbi:polyprotein [Phytophthora megakarya]|uniref:Polyprotein n=1 Tax=Phytophthora megakarya TaxID=4795 RepID=A0A225VAG3_9STRA|nr:polyprotein [Phytophthora megakarya]
MNNASLSSNTSLECTSFPHLSVIEWEALHRLTAVSGDSLIKALLTSGTEAQQHLAAQEFMVRELGDLRQRVSTPTATKNKTDIVKLDVSSYSDEGDGRLHLNRWFCEVDIPIEDRQLSTELTCTRFLLSTLAGKAKEWALGRLITDAASFPTMEAMKSDLRLVSEPAQDESFQKSAFLSLKQGSMSMLEYIQASAHVTALGPFAYELDRFYISEEFLVIELLRPRDIDVNAVETFLCGTPNQWPDVTVMDPDAMVHIAYEVSDGPSCTVCEPVPCAGPALESQNVSDVEEQRLSNETDVVERGLPQAVEHGFPLVVVRELPEFCGHDSAINLMDGFYQILMREDNVQLTSVSTPPDILTDTLSRRPDYVRSGRHAIGDEDDDECAVSVVEGVAAVEVAATSPLRALISAANDSDAECAELLEYLQDSSNTARHLLASRSRARGDRYALDCNLLSYCADCSDPPRIVVPLDDDLLGAEVGTFVRSVPACQAVSVKASAPSTPALRDRPMIFGDKMVHLAPVVVSVTAEQSAAIFLGIVYRHHDLPSSIVSDRDPRFTAAFWTELVKTLGTRLNMSAASHPETDGQTERANRFAINNAELASTEFTPFYINYCRHPRVPATLGLECSMVLGEAGDDNIW